MPIIECSLCNKTFNRKRSQILLSQKSYCSLNCARQAKRNGKVVPCHTCGKEIYKTQKQIRVSKSKKYFCSKSCQTKWRNTEFIGDKHSNYKDGRYSYRSVLTRNKVQAVCLLCKTKDKRVLAVHHIDQDHFNNDLKNLAWLCHNCHFLVHHDKLEKQRLLSLLKV